MVKGPRYIIISAIKLQALIQSVDSCLKGTEGFLSNVCVLFSISLLICVIPKYFMTYTTPLIDLILEYIGPWPWYFPWNKALGQYQCIGLIYSSIQSITG